MPHTLYRENMLSVFDYHYYSRTAATAIVTEEGEFYFKFWMNEWIFETARKGGSRGTHIQGLQLLYFLVIKCVHLSPQEENLRLIARCA